MDPRRVICGSFAKVTHLVGLGLRNREIAARLGLTGGTVKAYMVRIFDIVGVRSRVQLALWARDNQNLLYLSPEALATIADGGYMPNPKPFSVNFTTPSHAGAQPVKGGVTFASFPEVQAAVKAWSPNGVARADGSIVDSAGKQIGSYVKDTA
jgi:DNA-binding CsgD family transcriptional regulator